MNNTSSSYYSTSPTSSSLPHTPTEPIPRQRAKSAHNDKHSPSAPPTWDQSLYPRSQAYAAAFALRQSHLRDAARSITDLRVDTHSAAYSRPASRGAGRIQSRSASPIRSLSRADSDSSAGHSAAGHYYPTPNGYVSGPGSASVATFGHPGAHTPAGSRPPSRPTTPRLATSTAAALLYDQQTYSHAGPPTPRSRIPTRPRAYSASAVDVHGNRQETLTDSPVPPVPPISLHRSPTSPSSFSDQSHAYDHPRQSFPSVPPSPSSMSLSTHAPDPPHRLLDHGLHGSSPPAPSGIPVLKSRAKSTARSPSPDLPSSPDALNEPPPFRVDLDAALAEIEDELEVRAIQKFASARPNPSTPKARGPRTSVTPRTTPAAVKNTPGSAQRNRKSTGPTRNGGSPRTPAARTPTAKDKPSPVLNGTPNGSVNTRKRNGSLNGTASPAVRPRKTSAATKTTQQRVRAATISPSSSMSGSSPRLGVAAHFVPPETGFTPPKGADWDDVVLPTVAKKLGIAVVNSSSSDEAPSEDDLAVEWDKDGTPIRWEKRTATVSSGRPGLSTTDFTANSRSGSGGAHTGTDDFNMSYGLDQYDPQQRHARSSGQATSRPQSTQFTASRPAPPVPSAPIPMQPLGSSRTGAGAADAGGTLGHKEPAKESSKESKRGKRKGPRGGDGDEVKAGCGCVLM